MIKPPLPHSYWVLPGKLLAGEYPRNKNEQSSREKIGVLLGAGVNAFIDLTECEHEDLLPYEALLTDGSHERFPIRDLSVPPSRHHTTTILDRIDAHLEQGKLVYVHCWGGVGRTGVIIGCWLARHGSGGSKALERLRTLWRQCAKSSSRTSPETLEQERYILNWEAGW